MDEKFKSLAQPDHYYECFGRNALSLWDLGNLIVKENVDVISEHFKEKIKTNEVEKAQLNVCSVLIDNVQKEKEYYEKRVQEYTNRK